MSALVIKAICRQIEQRYGSNRNAAMAAGVSPGVWSNYCSDEHHDTTIPFHRLLLVANARERAAFVGLLEGEAMPPPASLMNEAGEAVEKVADLHKVVREATSDNNVTPFERRRIRDEAIKARSAIDDVIAGVGGEVA